MSSRTTLRVLLPLLGVLTGCATVQHPATLTERALSDAITGSIIRVSQSALVRRPHPDQKALTRSVTPAPSTTSGRLDITGA